MTLKWQTVGRLKGGRTNRGAAACLLSMSAPKLTQSTLTELSSSGRVEKLENWEELVKVGDFPLLSLPSGSACRAATSRATKAPFVPVITKCWVMVLRPPALRTGAWGRRGEVEGRKCRSEEAWNVPRRDRGCEREEKNEKRKERGYLKGWRSGVGASVFVSQVHCSRNALWYRD